MREDVREVVGMLPQRLKREIEGIALSRRGGLRDLYELRLRRDGGSVLVTAGGVLRLAVCLSGDELERVVLALCRGAVYSHADGISRGYISLDGGVRVGVCGRAAYDGGRIVGVGEVSTLVFRFPALLCEYSEELYRIWEGCGGNLLIASPPSGGKTTALRALASEIGSRNHGLSVVVVDERCEISGRGLPKNVDILRGYDRRRGIEVAYRTLSAEVILVDEISTEEEARATLSAYGVGVQAVATAHGGSFSELLSRAALAPILEAGMFERAVMIERRDGKFRLSEHRLPSRCEVRV